jgi:organic hydroperoxide reductase OsmC/OhrA
VGPLRKRADTEHRTHRYAVRVQWSGSTGAGYEAYDRTHLAWAPPAAPKLTVSSDPSFGGDPGHLNPEQLVVLAASSCQLLSFLAVAARARIDVRGYEDDGTGEMNESAEPTRLTSITLRPTIRVAPGASKQQIQHLVEVAHRECYVANSLRTEITVVPTVIVEAPTAP